MSAGSASSTYRVTVRGRFDGLSDRARQYLTQAADDHDIFKSAFTEEGTLTYDERLMFFNLRFELRVEGEAAAAKAERLALAESEAFLTTMGFGYKALRANVVDMSTMW